MPKEKEKGKAVEIVLETIGISHYAEKVRWCMDRAGIEYDEEVNVGILGMLLLGRFVPRLRDRSTANATISNSSCILRYVYGRFVGCKDKTVNVGFLAPSPAVVELEARMDKYGHNVRSVLYYHVLQADNKALRLDVWGAKDSLCPMWQRLMLKVFLPVLTLFMRMVFK
ncbi:unnamed protein product, partial [Choristocarpus tenellus]